MGLLFRFLFILLSIFSIVNGEKAPILKENIIKAIPGDFIVTHQGKMFSVMLIKDKTPTSVVIEEISAPRERIPKNKYNWKGWVEDNAPGNTSWVIYRLNTITSEIESAYSYTNHCWFKIKNSENFLSTLLTMPFYKIPMQDRKRIGPRGHPSEKDRRELWKPKMIVDGREVEGIQFDAWKARWPSDNSELAGKLIEVYIPEENSKYPCYFPYWLQISGVIGKAKIRIVESGRNLVSPKPLM